MMDSSSEGEEDGLGELVRAVYQAGESASDTDDGTEENGEASPLATTAAAAGPRKITLDDLLSKIEDPARAAALKKSAKNLSKTLEPPLQPRAKARQDRAAAFALTSEELEKWKETIHAIKDSQVLRFPLLETRPGRPSVAALAGATSRKAGREDELEQRIREILERDGLTQDEVRRQEQDEISINAPEEAQSKRDQLARLSLLALKSEKSKPKKRPRETISDSSARADVRPSKEPMRRKEVNARLGERSERSKVQARVKKHVPASEVAEPVLQDIQLPERAVRSRQQELIAQAFASDNVVADFEEEKRREIEEDAPKEENLTLPGWGSWGGKGVRTKRQITHHQTKPGIKASQRKDFAMSHVIISEKRQKRASEKYTLKDVPHPFESREQYEQAMRMPVGGEWNTRDTFQRMTTPRVMKRIGQAVGHIDRPL